MSIITIVGSGMMGSAMSVPAADNGHQIRLVGTPLDREIIASVQKNRYHPRLDFTLPEAVQAYQIEQLQEVLPGSDLLIGGISSFGIQWFEEQVLPLLPDRLPVLLVTKGLEAQPDGNLLPFPLAIGSRLAHPRPLHAIGGPCTSYELIRRQHTAVAFCGSDLALLQWQRKLLATEYYHVRCTTDVKGLECAVALKNAYALAVTMAVGMTERQHGIDCPEFYNPAAALFGQSVREMGRLIRLLGGQPDCISYAAGDLYVTVYGGRTRKLGRLLGRVLSFQEAKKELADVTLESVAIVSSTAQALRQQAASGRVRLEDYPLLMMLDAVINHQAEVQVPWDRFGE